MMRALVIATVCFPLFRVHDGEGQVILTWKVWQVFLYLAVWWNLS